MPTLKNVYDDNMILPVMASLDGFDQLAYDRTNLTRLQLFTKKAIQTKRSDCNVTKLESDIRDNIQNIREEVVT